MRKSAIFLSIILSGLFFIACENLSSSEDNTLEVDQLVEQHAAFGWQMNRMVSSSSEIEGITQNSEKYDEEAPEIANSSSLKADARRLMNDAVLNMPKEMPGRTGTADSLIFFQESFIGQTGKRTAVYYDYSTGKGRIYEVIFQFPDWRNLVYDSTEIALDFNFTLWDGSDDKVESLYKIQNFKEEFFVQRILSQMEVTDYDGQEIKGGIISKDAYYHENRPLSHQLERAELNPDGSGSWRTDQEYRDGTTAYNSVTFNSDNTGSFSKKRRDNTTISGEFDSVEDDLNGYYNETVDFPDGRYVDKIYKSAIVSITMPDSIFNADYTEIVYFSSGSIDSSLAKIQVHEENGVKTTILEQTKPNGAHGTLTITETETQSTLEGTWTTWNDYFIIVKAEYYIDGSAHVHYEVYEPPYTEGDDPIITADYYFSPDQSGNGTIAHSGKIYQISLEG